MPLRNLFARLRREDHGFSMVITMGAVAMMLVSVALAVQSVTTDQVPGNRDRDRKSAYAAAEAGLQVYVHKLINDNTYWAQCDGVPNDGLNQRWLTGGDPNPGPDPREWKRLPDNSAQWTIEMLPVSGKTTCDKNDPEGSMIAPGTPTFRIRITGQAVADIAGTGGTSPAAPVYQPYGPKRSLIATFKRKSFLDYIYFTDFETLDPAALSSFLAPGETTKESAGNNPDTAAGQRDLAGWGQKACANYAYVTAIANKPDGPQYRADQRFHGTQTNSSNVTSNLQGYCLEIQFSDNDWIQGPMHTNDTPLICGSPKFGRSPTDVIEIAGPGDKTADKTASWRTPGGNACGTSAPQVNFEDTPLNKINAGLGTWKYNQANIGMPKSNNSIKGEAYPAYTFKGQTTLALTAAGIVVTGTRKDGSILSAQLLAYPDNGVIYVDNDTCVGSYQVAAPYANRSGCGIAQVSGTYATDLTIAAADDILITDDIKRTGTAVLGLIANNFIRVYHPVTDQTGCASSQHTGSNAAGSNTDFEIDAAMLTLLHSFIVDNWQCGAPLGTLTVKGAIAQKFRGPVGSGSGKNMKSGYAKLYTYDDRLRVRIPPKFIDPVASAWGIQTYQEQVPAF